MMIIVDSSIWIDHFRQQDEGLNRLLARREILMHPFIIGEIAVGSMARRRAVLAELAEVPEAVLARHEEVMSLIEQASIFGTGVGFIDVHLLASARLSKARLWTRDKRLNETASRMKLSAAPLH